MKTEAEFSGKEMPRRTFLQVVGQVCTATCLGPDLLSAEAVAGPSSGAADATSEAADWATVSAMLEDASSTFTEPWDDAHSRTLMSGGYVGNGDLGAHLGGTKYSLKLYLGKNGFHAGNDVPGFRSGEEQAPGPYKQHILNLAILTVEAAAGVESGDTYRVTQDLKNAEIRTDCTLGGVPVQTNVCLSPSDNALVWELSTNAGREVRLQITLSVIGNGSVVRKAGAEGGEIWVTKEPNPEGAPFYVQGAVAARVLGAVAVATTDERSSSQIVFALPASGQPVRLFVQAEHTKNAASPLATVQAAVREMTEAGLAALAAQNRAWWRRFWLRSYIRLGDDVQRYWYNHLYLIGSAARSGPDNSPGKAPGHWGPWNRSDDMKWFGNLGMNYNAQNPYYGTFAANHVDLVDPYVQTIKYYAETTGRKRVVNRWVSPEIAARMPANCRGVEFEGSFTSHGTPSAGGGSFGNEDCCMTTNAVFGILPIVWKWKYGRDATFLAETAYPLMRAVVDFFDDYIGPAVNGKYEVYGSVHEGANWFAKNDMFSLGAMRFLYREIVAASQAIGRDADRRSHWQDILNNLSEYPLQAWGDKVTFKPDAVHDVMEALHYQGGARNTGVLFTTTFDNIGHKTLPAYRLATCYTLDRGNMFHPQRWCGWQNGNDFGMMFVMAVRAGYEANRVIEAIKAWKPEPNGVVSQKDGGGVETAGIIEAINSMLLQSHDGVLRIFPNWNPAVDAQFKRLRAVGAFLVEARYRAAGQQVDSVRIQSEKGGPCVLQSPFVGASLTVTRADTGQPVPIVQDEEEFSFGTTAGVTYEIARAESPAPPPNAPVIEDHPLDVTVTLPSTATFRVSARGRKLRYQWQKNRADIPGATSARYTTPATTLWDIGSAFRCVVSNKFGVVRSRPGILGSAGTPERGPHRILGTWSYRHAGRDYTREFTRDGRCILKDSGQIGWIKPYTLIDERTAVVEGIYVHTLTGADMLNIENVFTGKRASK